MRKRLLLAVAVMSTLALSAQQVPYEMKVWPDGAPNSNGITTPEVDYGEGRVGNVSVPVIYAYPADPAKNTGAAVVICPGGGYVRLAMNHEGHDFAKWLASNGINAIVLKYRMPNGHHDVPLSDVSQTVRIARQYASQVGINPKKIGVMGFSAGGHLASTAATHFDSLSRPDFAILFYPVVSFDDKIAHKGSKNALIGENAPAEIVNLYSNEKQVTAKTPPTLLLLSDDDKTVPSMNSVRFYQELKANNVPAAMYIFPTGGHGWGFRNTYKYHEEMKSLVIKWLSDIKITE